MGNSFITRAEWRIFRDIRKQKLKNRSPSIISSNCIGGIISHDLGLRFNSPTVNLYFETSDYLRLLSDPRKYFSTEPIESASDLPYPVGDICGIKVYFMHYSTFEEARLKWIERSSRVDYDNLFVMMTDKNGCTDSDLSAFDALPYDNKIVFVHTPHPEIKSSYYIPGFEDKGEVGILSDFKDGFWRRRWIDDFDYVSFLNGFGIKK